MVIYTGIRPLTTSHPIIRNHMWRLIDQPLSIFAVLCAEHVIYGHFFASYARYDIGQNKVSPFESTDPLTPAPNTITQGNVLSLPSIASYASGLHNFSTRQMQ